MVKVRLKFVLALAVAAGCAVLATVEMRSSRTAEVTPLRYIRSRAERSDHPLVLRNRLAPPLIETNEHVRIIVANLVTGDWYGVNEDETFLPGSLLKVLLAIGYFKKAEENPRIFFEAVKASKDQSDLNDRENLSVEKRIVAGQTYEVRDLLRRALIYSDNGAADILEQLDQHASLKRTAREMNIPVREGVEPKRPITLHEYAKVFLALYDATYLNPEASNLVLETLAHSDYSAGLRAAVPRDVEVARKYGVAIRGSDDHQFLSECGIVYRRELPYLSCVSLDGANLAELEPKLRLISEAIFAASKRPAPSP